MRIVFISSMGGSPWGGSETLWSEAALRLVEWGHQVMASVAAWPEIPDPIRKLQMKGVAVSERNPEGVWRQRFSRLVQKSLNLDKSDKHWLRILEFNPDLVCISNGSSMCGLEWMEWCKNADIPCVSIIQANSEHWWPSDGVGSRMVEIYKDLKRVYFVSGANMDLFQRQIGIRLSNCEVVRNPFGVNWNSPPSWPDGDVIRFACVARLEPGAKGQDLLFQVLGMQKWRERPLTVSLCGGGPCEMGLRRLAEAENISEIVSFAGHVADVSEIWRNHHALILPSRYEGLPLSLIETMLSERPSIVTDVAGNKEIVEDNVTGFVAAFPSVLHLDEAMERAWLRRDEWPEIGRLAGITARAQLPRDPAATFAGKLLELFKF